MTKRKRLPLRWARKLLKRQGGTCAVKGCPTVLVIGPRGQHVNWIDEHIQALGRGGTNALKNRELRCIEHAHKKTHHPRSKATTIGGDNYEIKKTGRMKRKHKAEKVPFGGYAMEYQLMSAAAEKSRRKRKIQSAGFRKDISRGFDGKVRARRCR